MKLQYNTFIELLGKFLIEKYHPKDTNKALQHRSKIYNALLNLESISPTDLDLSFREIIFEAISPRFARNNFIEPIVKVFLAELPDFRFFLLEKLNLDLNSIVLDHLKDNQLIELVSDKLEDINVELLIKLPTVACVESLAAVLVDRQLIAK